MKLREWLGWRSSSTELLKILRWVQRVKLSKFRKRVYNAMVAALVYYVWQQRNSVLWQQAEAEEAEVIQKVKFMVKMRANMIYSKCNIVDQGWFIDL